MSNVILILADSTMPGIADVEQAMFPNLPNFIAHILATVIIILFLTKLVYKPFKKLVSDRRKKFNELLDDAASKQALANRDKKDAGRLLIKARQESKDILVQAKAEADDIKFDIINEAKIEAQNIQDHAKQTIKLERNEAQENIRKEIIDLAFTAAEKIMEVNVDKDVNQKLIEEFLNNL